MKQLYVILILLLFLINGCKTYKEGYINGFTTEFTYYNDNWPCELYQFRYLRNYHRPFEYGDSKHYKPKRCLEQQYNFTKDEFKELREIFENQYEGKVRQLFKYNNIPTVYRAIYNNGFDIDPDGYYNNDIIYIKLVNKEMYGLFYLLGARFTPSFLFLRTENSLYLYDCDEKEKYVEALEKSVKIDEELRRDILSSIKKQCKTGKLILN
jgi:hypothetical protein